MHKLRLILGLLFCTVWAYGQEGEAAKEAEKALQASTNLTWDANKELTTNDFIAAEGEYRKAISKSSDNTVAPFNLGTAYYNRESFEEAFGRFKQAGEKSKEKPGKHKAFHNMGNVFMKNKEYQKAVEAYKEALRNNPTDEETRYNLALAKKMMENQQDEQNNDQNDDNQDQQDQQDQKDKNQDQNNDGENDKDRKASKIRMRTKIKAMMGKMEKTSLRKILRAMVTKRRSKSKNPAKEISQMRSNSNPAPTNFQNSRYKIC